MIYIFSSLLTIVLIALVLWVFVNSDARAIINAFKLVIPVTLMAVGIIATISGKGQYGIPAIIAVSLWWINLRARQ